MCYYYVMKLSKTAQENNSTNQQPTIWLQLTPLTYTRHSCSTRPQITIATNTYYKKMPIYYSFHFIITHAIRDWQVCVWISGEMKVKARKTGSELGFLSMDVYLLGSRRAPFRMLEIEKFGAESPM